MSKDAAIPGKLLPPIARAAIATALGQHMEADESAPSLQQPGASFVTLKHAGKLRGCIGSLEAHRPLLQDVKNNAQAAALRDPRFTPLTLAELADTQIEVSILTPPEPLTFTNEAHACAQLRPGIDGVLLEYGPYRGTFLPQVWEQLPTSAEFMRQLKQKAGLPPDFWADDLKLYRYHVQKWAEIQTGH